MKVIVAYMKGEEVVTEEFDALSANHAGYMKEMPIYMIQEEERTIQLSANCIISIVAEKGRIQV